jgi:hypothetical protein
MKLSGHQGLSRRVRKTSPSPGFDFRTVQFVACRYIAYATPDHSVSAAVDMNLNNMTAMAIGLHRLATKNWYVRNTQDMESLLCAEHVFMYLSLRHVVSAVGLLIMPTPQEGASERW